MTPDEYSDIKQLYKFAIAYDAFTEVSKACEDIIARELKSDDPLYHVMTIGICPVCFLFDTKLVAS